MTSWLAGGVPLDIVRAAVAKAAQALPAQLKALEAALHQVSTWRQTSVWAQLSLSAGDLAASAQTDDTAAVLASKLSHPAVRHIHDLMLVQSRALIQGMHVQATQTGPVCGSLEVGKDNLRRLIGPQGSVIRGLEADSASRLSIDDTGLVHIYSPGQDNYQTAVSLIEGITGAAIKARCCPAQRRSCKLQDAMLSDRHVPACAASVPSAPFSVAVPTAPNNEVRRDSGGAGCGPVAVMHAFEYVRQCVGACCRRGRCTRCVW